MKRTTIFSYPAVQYIPLSLEIIYRKQQVETRPFLLIGSEIEERILKLNKKLGIDPPLPIKADRKLYLLAGGLDLRVAKYRGYYVTIAGTKDSSVSLYRFPACYFYKETLVFEVKDPLGNVLLSRAYRLEPPLLKKTLVYNTR